MLYINNQTTKSLSALVALIRHKGSVIHTVKTILFYFTYGYSTRLLTEYFRFALKQLKAVCFIFIPLLFLYYWQLNNIQ